MPSMFISEKLMKALSSLAEEARGNTEGSADDAYLKDIGEALEQYHAFKDRFYQAQQKGRVKRLALKMVASIEKGEISTLQEYQES